VIIPSDGDVDEALAVLGMKTGDCRCAYCGDLRTEWDHFRAIVKDRRPTGYITEIANLVPSCGKCNQSKGNKHWKDWMLSKARRSPRMRQIRDLDDRVTNLEAFQIWRDPIRIDYQSVIGKERWLHYCEHLQIAVRHLADAQKVATELLAITSATVNASGLATLAASMEIRHESH
jgi:hypothetical protein